MSLTDSEDPADIVMVTLTEVALAAGSSVTVATATADAAELLNVSLDPAQSLAAFAADNEDIVKVAEPASKDEGPLILNADGNDSELKRP